ncbi:hypothetical protein DW009_22840 [Klebsiella pneumoniae]|nr:hypothetical protein [Klebsiella pneumoniae]MBK3200636.1 hypothetical protein [Klebsiella pneumoniae]QIV53085.1 hypothetical protein FVE92_01505 [Klebsiella pneumoniae]RGO48573.1 hypothetical protein DXB11_24815 [Klebsiella pneumoniae]RHL66282.1 hypothetical protein DW009_22840 [Klebsiella pneumoniae]
MKSRHRLQTARTGFSAQRPRLAGKPGMLVIRAVIMRKLIHIISGVLRSGTVYFHQITEKPACQ